MSKRCGYPDKNLVTKSIALILILVFVLFFSFGCAYKKEFEIENYSNFIQNLIQYDENYSPDLPQKPVDPDIANPIKPSPDGPGENTQFESMKISGYELLTKDSFSQAEKFSGEYAFVKSDENNYLINLEGEIIETSQDLTGIRREGVMYVTHRTEFYGVMTIFGDIILDEVYDHIQIYDSTILAISENTAIVFLEKNEISKCVFDTSVVLLNESYILKDNIICDLHFREMYAGDYLYKDLPGDGLVLVDMGEGNFGYVNLETQNVISGPYISAGSFLNGFATAQTPDGNFVVINSNGTVVYDSDVRIVGTKCGRYYCFLQNNLYGVMNENFEVIVKPIFTEIKYEQVIGEYLLARHGRGMSVYSLLDQDFVSEIYDDISYEDGLFICISVDKYYVLNTELNIIAECEFATSNEGILLIGKEGKYFYYKRSSDE